VLKNNGTAATLATLSVICVTVPGS